MTSRFVPVMAGLAVALSCGALADPPAKIPARYLLEQHRIEVAPDASVVSKTRLELQVLDAAIIPSLAQQPMSYSETTQQLDIDEAYTLKKDGTKLVVAPEAIVTQQRPATPGVTMLTDQKQKVVIYPNVEVGDTLVSARTLKAKPLIPGLYATGFAFSPSLEVDASEVVVTAPKSQPLYYDVKDLTVEKSADGDKLVYTVRTKNEKPETSVSQYVTTFDRSPYVFFSTMKSWEQLGKAHGALVQAKWAVTPKLQAKADEITAGVSDKREQVNKIYEWVTSHIRYVALEFGQGGYVPHDPEEVMAKAYGDCKDHAMLFGVLLKAKGIAADLVTIHGSDGYTVPKVPTANVFNHMINYIPSLGIYADTTQRTMALGYLQRGEYGKSVLHIGPVSYGLRKTPMLTDKDNVYAYSEHQKLDGDGHLTGDGVFTTSGFAAGLAHRDGLQILRAGASKFASDLLEKRGLSDAAGSFEVSSSEPAVAVYKATTHYYAPKQSDKVSGVPFAMPRGLVFDGLIGESWLGPIANEKYAKAAIMPCFGANGSEEYTLDFPAGKKVAKLPADVSVDADGLKYASHWSQSGHAVTVKRTLSLQFKDALCRGAQRSAIRDALTKIRADYKTTLSLVAE